MAYILIQELIQWPSARSDIGPDAGVLSGQRYEEPDLSGEDFTFGNKVAHSQARGCFTMGRTVDGNYIVLGERPPTQ